MLFSPLLRTRRFLPLFITQFLGALNDNFFKNAVVILVTYRISTESHIAPQTLVTLSGALFIFPYIIFCATAGKLADKFDKAVIARIIKCAEVFFMCLAVVGFMYHLIGFLFVVLFCMGAHSAFFSPVKYALLPDHLRSEELMEGNAFIEAGTFIATLLGTIAGGVLVLPANGEVLVSASVIIIALLGVLASRFIPPATMLDPTVKVRLNLVAETWDILSYVAKRKPLLKGIIANSWFWFVGGIFISLFPAYTKQIIGANEHVVTLFLTSFSVGIGLGAIACGSLLKGNISTYYVPWSALGMSIFIGDMYWISPHTTLHHEGALLTLEAFLAQGSSWRMVFDFFAMSVLGGFYIVPLYAIIQRESEPKHRAQVMASNNVVNAFFMVGSALMALGLFACNLQVTDVFLVTGILNTIIAVWLFSPYGKLMAESY
jgi:acyl-[acyl-carrier-protein]-phospholipid O-acyltransferase/long-chain-fatty-acid--[acyl-carrier-protein] ligase